MEHTYSFKTSKVACKFKVVYSQEAYDNWNRYFAVLPRAIFFPWAYRLVDASRREPEFLEFMRLFKENTKNFTKNDQLKAILFICRALEYETDFTLHKTADYWSTAIETLYIGQGDCEDYSILICACLAELGYDCCLIFMRGHMACGIAGDFSGEYVEYDGKKYYYVESTSNRAIGEMADFAVSKKKFPIKGYTKA